MKKYIYSILMLSAFSVTANAQTMAQALPDGTRYNVFTHNTGDKIKLNDVITFNVIQKTDKDSVLSSSYTAPEPPKFQVQDPMSIKDPVVARVMEVITLVTVNDSLEVRIPIDSLLKGQEDKRPPFFPKGSFLNLYIKVIRVQALNDAINERNSELAKLKADDSLAAGKYIADNKLLLKTTASGLKYQITKLGLKPKPLAGDTVYVNYTGKLLNGKVFDSSIQAEAQKAGLNQPGRNYEPINFVLGTGGVIQGWEEGLLLVNEGGKATFIIPPKLGYADQPQGDQIPPYSTLIFDIEITKVARAKHAVAPAAAKKPLPKKHITAKQ
jgi:FKBP-type peptidyl-prolyl cis-trans isomerase FkpA